ncbi:MAG: serine/threonine protein kinase [Blastocatellia bacterium]|nr:serine/threonine protein kinase [Blastocatellia bacterium]
MIGKTVAQYKILEILGKGGMGQVYKAHDTQLDRTVVLKLLSSDLLTNDTARKRFAREARLASVLDHPNICMIYEIQEKDSQFFIVMQYVEGQTLKQTINNQPLANNTLISIALQVADALSSAICWNSSPRHQAPKYNDYSSWSGKSVRFWLSKKYL